MSSPEADLRWSDRARELRNRLLASPRFQRWATRFFPTRPIARRSARRLFDLCAGFVYSQVLLACVQLDLFGVLSEGPQTVSRLATRLDLSTEAARRLLKAAASLELVESRGGDRFGLGPLGAAFRGNPGIAAMVEHHALLYADLADPLALLRGEIETTQLSRYWPYARDALDARKARSTTPHESDSDAATGKDEGPSEAIPALGRDRVAGYSALMSASQSLVADQVLDLVPLTRHRCLLDVGGGDGTFLEAAARRAPDLRIMLFDFPSVAGLARERFERAGLGDRADAIGGDFRIDPLPEGADIVSLIRIVHDHDDEAALGLLRAVHRALPAGGVLLLAEPMSGTAGAEPVGDAYFGLYLLAMGSGRARSPQELCALVRAAGFRETRLVPTPMPLQTGLLIARA